MKLAALQAQFQAAVRGEGEAPPLRGRMAERGLAVYAKAYPARLREALADNYPALAQALGDEGFAELADAYAAAHPPREPSIRWHGQALPDFVAAQALHPALTDLARLDWALRQAFDGALFPSPDREALAALPPEAWTRLRARLQPHASLLQLDWAVAPLWHALEAAREAGEERELPPPQEHAHALLVGREGLRTQWRSLADDEAEALALLLAAPSLAVWLSQLGEAALPQAMAWLLAWVEAQSLLIA